MSYARWTQIKDQAVAYCDAAERSLNLHDTAGGSFVLAERFNNQMDQTLDEITLFMNETGVTVTVDEGDLLQRIANRKSGTLSSFGTGKSGLADRFSAIHVLVPKIDRIYGRELSGVEKTEHALAVL